MNGDLEMRISRWKPDGPKSCDETVIAFVRSTVEAAGPRQWDEARNALKWAFEYLQWLPAATGLDADALFAAERIDAYDAAVCSGAVGTRAARKSYLKRLHPAVGFAGSTRVPAVAAAGDAPLTPLAPTRAARPVMLAPAVEAAIDQYVPNLISPADWAAVAHFVRDVVRAAVPSSPSRAAALCRDMTYLAVWAHGDHRRVGVGTTLDSATIEAFLTVLLRNRLESRSVASFAANLHHLREIHGVPLDVARRSFPAPASKAPYNQSEVDMFFEVASRIPSSGRRRQATATLNLMFGVGAMPGEVAFIEPHHISDDGLALVELTRPSRFVTSLEQHRDGIDRARRDALTAGDRFLLGGQANDRSGRLSGLLAGGGKHDWKIGLDVTRARATWLVESAASPCRYPTIVDHLTATGLTTLVRLDELLPYISARRNELTRFPADETPTDLRVVS